MKIERDSKRSISRSEVTIGNEEISKENINLDEINIEDLSIDFTTSSAISRINIKFLIVYISFHKDIASFFSILVSL